MANSMKTTKQDQHASVRFRFAELKDIPSIVALLADDALGAGREATDRRDVVGYEKAFAEMGAQGGNKYLLAVDRDEIIIGCVQITLIAGLSRAGMKRAQLEGVRVAESARGQGVGKRLIAEAHAIAADQGCGLVQLTTDRSRLDALRFYESLGYIKSHHGMKLALS